MMNQSGYFARLIDRARERGPALTPRRAARFEPTSLQGSGAWQEDIHWSPAQSGEPQQPALPAAASHPQEQMMAASARALTVSPPEHAEVQLPAARAPAATHPTPAARSPLHVETVLAQPRAPNNLSDQGPGAVLQPVMHGHATEAHQATSQLPGAAAVTPRRVQSAEGPRPALRHLRPAPQQLAPARRKESIGSRVAAGVNPGEHFELPQPSAAAQFPAFPATALPPPSTPEPRVTIHIGRIEVRARMERPQPTAAGAKSAPRLGLEEYLRRQESRR